MKMSSIISTAPPAPAPAPEATAAGDVRLQPHIQQAGRFGWHSPVPYLFVGLAAMLGLIAFALIILVCSFWRLSGRQESDAHNDLESGGGGKADDGGWEKVNVLVIMAGHVEPTFLATASSSAGGDRSSTTGDSNAAHSRVDEACKTTAELPERVEERREDDEETRHDQRQQPSVGDVGVLNAS